MSEPALSPLSGGGVPRLLDLARRHLEMDLAYLAQCEDGKQVYRGLAGDSAGFGVAVGDRLDLAESLCGLLVEGVLANAQADLAEHPRAAALPETARLGVRAFIGVPVHLSDGTLYGTFCCVSRTPAPLDTRDVNFMTMLAELVVGEVESHRSTQGARSRIQEVIDGSQIDIALQPIVDLRSGTVLGVEALSRFPGGHGTPDVVFAAAHAAGLGAALEQLASQRAFELLPSLGDEVYLAVNLTPGVAIELAMLAAAFGDMPYDRLVLEITEHEAVESYVELRDSLAAARRSGLRLAIDDAGAGYASLHHVVELSPDIIKIDRSLIDGMSEDRGRRSVCAAFTRLAADLGATVIAEGVEQTADLHAARDVGVHAAQGYLLARPSTDRADLARWLEAGVELPH